MNATEVVAAVKALPGPEQERVLRLLLQDKTLRENLLDSLTIEQRKDEPSRPLADMLKDYLTTL